MENHLLELDAARLLKKVEHKEFILEYYEDYTIVLKYKAPFDVDVPLIERVNTEIINLVQDHAYTTIVFAEPGVNFTAEGRAYGAEKGNGGNKVAWAAVTDSLAQILVFNFFMRFNKPHVPFKLFKTEKEARKWLRDFK
jgi:hypothetical protein